MIKKILLVLLLFGATNLFAQPAQDFVSEKEIQSINDAVFKQRQEINVLTKTLDDQNNILEKLNRTIEILQKENKHLSSTLSQRIETNSKSIVINFNELESKIKETAENAGSKIAEIGIGLRKQIQNNNESLRQLIQSNSKNIESYKNELASEIKETRKTADSKISQLDSNVEKNRLYWITVTLITLLLGGFIYWLLGKRIKLSKTDVETQIKDTKIALEEEGVKLDNKLVEVLETQLKLKQEESKSQPIKTDEEADHSLALKVADEIIRIQKNLSRMDDSIKGLKQLNSSVQRIQDNFAANGYELVEMLGKDYNEGMKVSANFIPSEDIEVDREIITRIIKPQVNFKGKMIQSAQIEVSIGE